ncbi:MAG TPA: hypothetical protein VGZ04_04975 [Acidimicrobiales bacterium]|jgi:hypothetical protein|nr:hypothetical protein [Acidimicrobiales bacterium]
MATSTKFRRGFVAVAMSASLLSVGALGVDAGTSGATTAPKSIPLVKGNLKFHLSWGASTTGASLAGALGKFRISGEVTQPNPNATTYVLKGLTDGFALHVVLVEGVSANAVTFSAKGSVGNRTLNATGVIRTSATGAISLTLTGKIGVTKISGKFPLSAFTITSVSGVIKVT